MATPQTFGPFPVVVSANTETHSPLVTIPTDITSIVIVATTSTPAWSTLVGQGVLDWGARLADDTPIIYQDSRVPPSAGLDLGGTMTKDGHIGALGISPVAYLAGNQAYGYFFSPVDLTINVTITIS